MGELRPPSYRGRVVSSTPTQVECSRALTRAVGLGRLGRGEELAALRLLDAAAARWAVLEMSGKVLARARGAFPVEPVRTLDALHLSTVLQFREEMPGLVVVSLDDRVRANAVALALPVRRDINPLIAATVHATEEAILNAMLAAETVTGINGYTVPSLPHDRLREIMERAARAWRNPG